MVVQYAQPQYIVIGKKVEKNLKKFEKSAWQMALVVILYQGTLREGRKRTAKAVRRRPWKESDEPWKLNNEKQRNPWDFFERKRDFATVKFGLRKKFEKRYARVSVNERESSEKGLDILGCIDTIF